MRGSSRGWLLGSLLAAHVVLPLAAFAVSYPRPDDWAAQNVFRIVVFGEAGMLCVWAGLGDQSWQRRLFVTLAGLTACWILLWFRETGQTPEKLVRCLLFPGAASVVLAIAIKLSPDHLVDREGGTGVWQFSVGQLLIFTSMVAVLIVLVQQSLKGNIVFNSRRLVMAQGAQIGVVLLVWAALGARWRKLRLALASVAACAVGLIVQSFMSHSWFWDVLDSFPNVSAARIWEDLLSIPAAILLESLLAGATVIASRACPGAGRSPPTLP